MIWNEPKETMSRDERMTLQSARLRNLVERVYYNVPFYRKKMQAMNLEPGDIRDITDITKLPYTLKKDLRDNYPFGLFALPKTEIVRVHASSGTTGKPIVVGYNRKDLSSMSEVTARALTSAGVTKDDIVQVAFGYGLFTGGLGIHDGVQKIGATVVPISGGNTRKQLQLMQDFGSTVLACTPSYAAYLGEAAEAAGIDTEKLPLRIGIFGAEPWTRELKEKIEKSLHIKAYDIYGLTEVMGPGVAAACSEQNGLHIQEDMFFPEIIDPNTLEPMETGPDGKTPVGELTFTTLTKEAMPLLRYRTRDLTSLDYSPCACGRTTARIGKFLGRSDDMLIIRGVNVFPSQIEAVLMEVPEVRPVYQIIADRKGTLDTLEVQVELADTFFSDEISEVNRIKAAISRKIESVLGISVNLHLVEANTLPRSEGKSVRVIDNRKLID